MRVNVMRWTPRTGLLALALIVVLPELAAAQANALFPDIYIKRQRECCANEDPQYRMIREQYFGYFPTCWRRFPPGWGCLSPDAPNWEEALRKLPLEIPEGMGAAGEEAPAGPTDDPFMRPGREPEGALPELPRDEGTLFPTPDGRPRPEGTEPRPDVPGDPAAPAELLQRPGPTAAADPSDLEVPALEAAGASDEVPPPLSAPASALPSSTLLGSPPPVEPSAMVPSGDNTVHRATARRGVISQLIGRMRRR